MALVTAFENGFLRNGDGCGFRLRGGLAAHENRADARQQAVSSAKKALSGAFFLNLPQCIGSVIVRSGSIITEQGMD